MRLRSRPTPLRRNRARIERDLAQLGVDAPLRESLALRLEALTTALSEEAYRAALAGVAAAHDLHRIGEEGSARNASDYREIQRLLATLSTEMKKLDAALRVLASHVQRMHRPPRSGEAKPIVH